MTKFFIRKNEENFMKEYKKPINERVIKVLNTLLESQNLTSLAADLGIKQPKLSEILALRMAAGLDVISELCIRFSVSPDYLLLGLGSMFRGENQNQPVPVKKTTEDVISLKTYESKVEECALLKARIAALEEQAARYAEERGVCSGITSPMGI